jgi:DNA polymerase
MGGEHDRMSAAEAASVLSWWIEAGVDIAIQDVPRSWLAAGETPPPPEPHVEAQPEPAAEIPESLQAFRDWLGASPSVPLAKGGLKRVLPVGAEAAEIMLLTDMPSADDAADNQAIGGPSWELTKRMLAAIGLSTEQAYVASLSCVLSPGTRLTREDIDECAKIARRHIGLARPRRLLLLGDGPSRALLGKPLAAARGHIHKVEGVRTVATFHPRMLLERSSDKARAWSDLLLLMEEDA